MHNFRNSNQLKKRKKKKTKKEKAKRFTMLEGEMPISPDSNNNCNSKFLLTWLVNIHSYMHVLCKSECGYRLKL